jgi:hypothetical protein
LIGLTFFKEIGAPIIAFAEIALLIEAVILFSWLSKRTHEPIKVGNAVGKGLVAAVFGGITTYAVALYLPGGAIVTALLGMMAGGMFALAIVWSDAKQLLNL